MYVNHVSYENDDFTADGSYYGVMNVLMETRDGGCIIPHFKQHVACHFAHCLGN